MGVIISIIVIIVLLLIGIITFILYRKAKATHLNLGKVADYEKRVNIWDKVPGNSSKSKLMDMDIDYNSNLVKSTIGFASAIVGSTYKDKAREIDTFTYFYEIRAGFEQEVYEDEPYIIPYLVKNSDEAVIVIPGGGFGYKSMDGGDGEGKDVAEVLNQNGINAFVFHYRTNPYEYPIPYLDLQRAIRFLRYHKEEYHIDENKISLIGFSAGGHMIGMHINKLMGKDFFPEEYEKDEIDMVDDKVDVVSMIYPVVSFNDNVPMLFALFNSDDVRDERKRKKLLEDLDLVKNFNSSKIKQFVAYGDIDLTVGTKEIPRYIKNAKKYNTDITVVVAKKQGHGFERKCYIEEYIKWIKENVEQEF